MSGKTDEVATNFPEIFMACAVTRSMNRNVPPKGLPDPAAGKMSSRYNLGLIFSS